jgi:hypothetical protein
MRRPARLGRHGNLIIQAGPAAREGAARTAAPTSCRSVHRDALTLAEPVTFSRGIDIPARRRVHIRAMMGGFNTCVRRRAGGVCLVTALGAAISAQAPRGHVFSRWRHVLREAAPLLFQYGLCLGRRPPSRRRSTEARSSE